MTYDWIRFPNICIPSFIFFKWAFWSNGGRRSMALGKSERGACNGRWNNHRYPAKHRRKSMKVHLVQYGQLNHIFREGLSSWMEDLHGIGSRYCNHDQSCIIVMRMADGRFTNIDEKLGRASVLDMSAEGAREDCMLFYKIWVTMPR